MFDLFKNKEARKSMWVSLIFHVGQQLSCINGVLMFSNDILQKEGNPKLKTVYVGIMSLISSLISICCVEKMGRKAMFLLSVFICTIALSVLSFNVYVVFMLFLFMFGFNIGLGPVAWLVVGEIFDEDYRFAGAEIAVGANWISNFLVVVVFKSLLKMFGSNVFLLFSGSMVVVFCLIFKLFTETKGRCAGFLE